MRNRAFVLVVLACFGVLPFSLPAIADYSQDFEGLDASAAGVILTGQDDYYLPNGPPGDTDFMCYTYAGNALGIVQNPEGGAQFIGGTGPGNSVYARAERSVTFGYSGIWEIWYDFCGIYSGSPPGSNNIGSMSMRLETSTVHINLLTWVDPNSPTLINSTYVYYDANNVQSPIPGTPPGPEWSNLDPNHWYRARTVIDLDLNMIIEVGIRDLSGGTEAVYNPSEWYLYGGYISQGPPDAIRWFGGGGTAGNSTAWDNAYIREQVPVMAACCLGEVCQLVTEPECQELGGIFHPEWDSCGPPNPCESTPANSESWGAIKNRFR